jgi:hypothetical protein
VLISRRNERECRALVGVGGRQVRRRTRLALPDQPVGAMEVISASTTWGRCYNHQFLRFLPIFPGKKLAFFSKTNSTYDKIFAKTTSSGSAKKTPIFRQIFCRKYFKTHNIGPRSYHQELQRQLYDF